MNSAMDRLESAFEMTAHMRRNHDLDYKVKLWPNPNSSTLQYRLPV